MLIVLQEVLVAEDIARVRAQLAAVRWVSGKRTAGVAARSVKHNLQADAEDPRRQGLDRFLLDALRRHALFDVAARPKRISPLLVSRYEPGMTYGAHTDDALMGAGEHRLRTDVAFTLFLSDLDAYDGGALIVHSAHGDQEIRLGAGDAILYPAGSIHQVSPVTRGARLAAVGWIESHIPDASARELLFDLSNARARLAGAGAAREDLLVLDRVASNLLRMWAR